jgi:hypothetical protein
VSASARRAPTRAKHQGPIAGKGRANRAGYKLPKTHHAAGFEKIEVEALIPGMTKLIMGYKPA